jgi:nucleotide-binding universal stress UspA family protein
LLEPCTKEFDVSILVEEMMPKILVAVDGLPGSEKALEAAVREAQVKGGHVTALAVLDRTGDPHLERLAEDVLVRARQRLEEVLGAAANFARTRGVELTGTLREGHPAETIVACAEQEGTELVVLGSHNGGDQRSGLGGTADRVSSHVPCTVLIVK